MFIPWWVIVAVVAAYLWYRSKQSREAAPRTDPVLERRKLVAMDIARAALKDVAGGDGDSIIDLNAAELNDLARSRTSHLNSEQAEMEMLVRLFLRGLRLQWIREWLALWETNGATIPSEIRSATNDELLDMDPERLFAVKYSAVRKNLGG